MEIQKTTLPGLLVLQPRVFGDNRGYFFESYREEVLSNAGYNYHFVQDNQSRSTHGVLRGLHYQIGAFAQAKLVRVFIGEVLDVAVDIRKGSPTFGQVHTEVLSADNCAQLMVPRGFAHGFVVLSESAEFFYKCDNYYSKEHERGIRFDDPELNIDWRIDVNPELLSDKDKELPYLKDAEIPFEYNG